ncbi:Fic/DOC family protein [Marinibacterium profundimaris]|uniref:protein adenylyltransferase n=1 Tax=Marinibacterium profundimaris TaxID=1679460 RepID=A0A225NJ16_9RHOB|nr:Fic family protein [Marinibacterium profundimaris]OWU68662.1 adenosine monophosphate-protein transferase [Marinibacterium profundimaris]
MSRYDATEDPLCYPGTSILRNKADLTDQDELDQFEQLMFLTRSEEALPEGALDYEHYRAIHHHFFQDVYEWAGQARQIRTAKGGNWFCYPEYIDAEMNRIFRELAEENHLADTNSLQDFAARAAHYIADINAVHPFREGNGRCQLTFLDILMQIAGLEMIECNIDENEFIDAMIASFVGDEAPLVDAIIKMAG